ncbi:hypothetical protein [Actinomadura sp. 21ATH]|uniref:hypothetical protein n=1 Tax=Actinomadura sp. 21ATH TaxID=1735444 RepID=UPI0035BF3D87
MGTREERATRARALLRAQRLERRAAMDEAGGDPALYPAIAQARIDARRAAGRSLLDDLPALEAYRRPGPRLAARQRGGHYFASGVIAVLIVFAGLIVISDQWPLAPRVVHLHVHSTLR